MNKNFSTCIALFIAINLTGIGVALFVQANLGSDTITVFIDGFKNILHTSLGGASRIYNLLALFIALLLSKKDIGWCTIVYACSVGFVMDFYNQLMIGFDIRELSIWIRICVVVIGEVCFCVTYSLLILYRKGMNQMDAISYGIARRTSLSYPVIRTMLDAILLLSGWLMGGVVGIGSIITMSTTGYIVNCMTKKTIKYRKQKSNGA